MHKKKCLLSSYCTKIVYSIYRTITILSLCGTCIYCTILTLSLYSILALPSPALPGQSLWKWGLEGPVLASRCSRCVQPPNVQCILNMTCTVVTHCVHGPNPRPCQMRDVRCTLNSAYGKTGVSGKHAAGKLELTCVTHTRARAHTQRHPLLYRYRYNVL